MAIIVFSFKPTVGQIIAASNQMSRLKTSTTDFSKLQKSSILEGKNSQFGKCLKNDWIFSPRKG